MSLFLYAIHFDFTLSFFFQKYCHLAASKSNSLTWTNRVSVVKIQRRLDKPPPTFKQFLFNYHFTNSFWKSIMLLKPQILRGQYSNETVGIILALREAGKSYAQIADQVKISWLSIVYIFHRATCTRTEPYHLIKQAGGQLTLDA